MLRGIDSQGDSLEKPFNGLRTMKVSGIFGLYCVQRLQKKIPLTLCIGFLRGIDIQGGSLEKPFNGLRTMKGSGIFGLYFVQRLQRKIPAYLMHRFPEKNRTKGNDLKENEVQEFAENTIYIYFLGFKEISG
ncbi:hypothetical protein CEXT_550701 [Caerostris extrusa]|uniref:Uncharacterized protein n=1 Tax=Caerostris extrusa TaxID=172846 RepID=A0AAV4RWU9_CAEEX|nr:hypothetical protein CEXT_550701 [Caerostris extrusa]